jgi:hypothetical protein
MRGNERQAIPTTLECRRHLQLRPNWEIEADWRNRPPGRGFFAINVGIHLAGGVVQSRSGHTRVHPETTDGGWRRYAAASLATDAARRRPRATSPLPARAADA